MKIRFFLFLFNISLSDVYVSATNNYIFVTGE